MPALACRGSYLHAHGFFYFPLVPQALHWGFGRVEWGRSPAERALAVAGSPSGGEDPSSSQREGEPMHSSPVLQLSRTALGCFPLLNGGGGIRKEPCSTGTCSAAESAYTGASWLLEKLPPRADLCCLPCLRRNPNPCQLRDCCSVCGCGLLSRRAA